MDTQQAPKPAGPRLFVVATPIGNLGDMSYRAVETLQQVDLIAAEDTRRVRKLLAHYRVPAPPLISYYDSVEHRRTEELLSKLRDEAKILALVSDAGTPTVSDPGFRLIQAAREEGIPVTPIPGASAVTTLVSASGLPTDRFLFVGFLPPKRGPLQAEIDSWASVRGPVVFFAPLRRLSKILGEIEGRYPQARVCLGRELTKWHEEIVTLPVGDAREWVACHESLRGEATVMVDPAVSEGEAGADSGVLPVDDLRQRAIREFQAGASLRDLLRRYQDSGHSRSELYSILLDAKDQAGQD